MSNSSALARSCVTTVGAVLVFVVVSCSDGVTDPGDLAPGEFRADLVGEVSENLSGTAEFWTITVDGSTQRGVIYLEDAGTAEEPVVMVLMFKGPTRPSAGEYRAEYRLSQTEPMEDDDVLVSLGYRSEDGNLVMTRMAFEGVVRVEDQHGFDGSFELEFAPVSESGPDGDTSGQGQFWVH